MEYVADLKQQMDPGVALRAAVGGEFLATGILEEQLLRSLGLTDGQRVIDVGCGSGRLAYQMRTYAQLDYLGVDVVPDLVEYAARLCQRPEWRFRVSDGFSIPAEDQSADFVCFFSVFTHLTHEQCYRYLRETTRVLKAGGRIVFSFLEFRLPAHWGVFADSIGATQQHLNQFIERDAITAWANHLGLVVESISDGDKPHIPLDREVVLEDGRVISKTGNLGQSVAVLRVPCRESAAPERATYSGLNGSQTPVPAQISPVHGPAFPNTGLFRSLSTRAFVGGANAVLILGFSVEQPCWVLLRATGTRLVRHGISDVLPNPQIALHTAEGKMIAENGGWTLLPGATTSELRRLCATVGAEPLDDSGNDPALLLQVGKGTYSLVVRDKNWKSGIAQAEIHWIGGTRVGRNYVG